MTPRIPQSATNFPAARKWERGCRCYWPVLLAAAVSLVASGVSAAQPKPASSGTPEDKVLTTKDDWPISITYYPSKAGKESPVVVLLHTRTSKRLVWRDFAKRLQNAGYAAVAVDLRKHGQSQYASDDAKGSVGQVKPYDYRQMIVADLEAVKAFLLEEHHQQHLNVRKTAIVAPEMSAVLALNFAVRDWLRLPYDDAPTLARRTPRGQDVRAIVLISPEQSLPGITTTPKAVRQLRSPAWKIAFLSIYGSRDKRDKGVTRKLFQKLAGPKKNNTRVQIKDYNLPLRGVDLLGQKEDIEALILAFLEEHLLSLPGTWANRRSRAES